MGTETYEVEVRELPEQERAPMDAEQARRCPGFAGHEEEVAGVRKIPVPALKRIGS